jgi:metal transporter CNNM
VTDLDGEPVFVLDSHHFLRDALLNQLEGDPTAYWHRPIIVREMQTRLGEVIGRMKVAPERPDDDVIDNDLILVWGTHRRIITGSDLLGRLLRDIATVETRQVR